MMGGCFWWGALLSAVTLQLSLCQTPGTGSSGEGLISEAVELYNQREDGEYLFQFLTQLPPILLEEEEDSPAVVFLIKETGCLKSEDKTSEECEYKEDGEVKICGLFPEENEEKIPLRCEDFSQESRPRRAAEGPPCKLGCKIKKVKQKIKQKLRAKVNAVKTVIGKISEHLG